MSKAVKRGNSWNIRVYDYTDVNGKQHNKSFTAPTKAEVEFLAAQYKAVKRGKSSGKDAITVRQAIDRYIALSEVLSPTTLQGYERIKKYAFTTIMDRKVSTLDDEDMQVAINIESKRATEQTGKRISPKTVKNEWSLISAALKLVCKKQYIVKLPPIKKTQTQKLLPELDALLEATIGTEVELPVLLAAKHSLRMSEIRGLTCKSLVGDELYINQVMVEIGGEDILKETAKTEKSNRSVIVYPRVISLIKSTEAYQEYLKDGQDRLLIPMTRAKIYYHFEKAVKKAGIDMSFHDLRQMFASLMLTKVGAASRVVQGEGGWKTDYTINEHYSFSFASSRREATEQMEALFEKNIPKNIPKNLGSE